MSKDAQINTFKQLHNKYFFPILELFFCQISLDFSLLLRKRIIEKWQLNIQLFRKKPKKLLFLDFELVFKMYLHIFNVDGIVMLFNVAFDVSSVLTASFWTSELRFFTTCVFLVLNKTSFPPVAPHANKTSITFYS